MMNIPDLAEKILELIGGRQNVAEAQGCMTRLRVTVLHMDRVNIPALMDLPDVMGVVKDNPLQIVLGPGKAQKLGAEFLESLKDGYIKPIPLSVHKSWEANKAAHATHYRTTAVKQGMARLSGIFTPIIPAVIAAALCSGIGGLLGQLTLGDSGFLCNLSQLLLLIGNTFFKGFTVFTGIYAAKAFGGSPALGGLLGAFNLSHSFASMPGGGGGILGVLVGAWILSELEKFLRKRIPDTLNLLITPFVSLFLAGTLYIFAVMPVTGFCTELLIAGIRVLTDSPYMLIRLLTGFILSAVFLPMVMGGHHHIFVILYALELQERGDISLLPCLIMAGAGQVGASIAIAWKARLAGNRRVEALIRSALPAALLGVGEPLIYGVTLPMRIPFLTAGLGAGFGGALCLGARVSMCAWGISGIAAIPLMKTPTMMLYFTAGLLFSYLMGFLITSLVIRKEVLQNG